MRRLADEELAALIDRFSPGRHPKIAAALRELQDRRAGWSPERVSFVRDGIAPGIRSAVERHGQIMFDDLGHPDVARFRAARRSGERIEIDLHALGLSDADGPNVVAVRVVEQWPGTCAGGRVGVAFSFTTAEE